MTRPAPPRPWSGRRVLITAGPTREHLDPIRFLTNPSTGIMGFSLARAARDLGAQVTVVSGPTCVGASRGLKVVWVVTAREMHRAVLSHYRKSDVIISAAAVGDWRFDRTSSKKIKKTGKPLRLTLLPNPDIIADVARRLGRLGGAGGRRANGKGSTKLLVGFALETFRRLAHAREKLKGKGLDVIVANGPRSLGLGRARITILDRWGGNRAYPSMKKHRAAEEILNYIQRFF